jgi:hypothetical protein
MRQRHGDLTGPGSSGSDRPRGQRSGRGEPDRKYRSPSDFIIEPAFLRSSDLAVARHLRHLARYQMRDGRLA